MNNQPTTYGILPMAGKGVRLQPNGQPRRMLDTSRAEREFGYRASTDFESGIKETILWYQKNS